LAKDGPKVVLERGIHSHGKEGSIQAFLRLGEAWEGMGGGPTSRCAFCTNGIAWGFVWETIK
jgi:hypothetical protein